jgi:hypothetical protein
LPVAANACDGTNEAVAAVHDPVLFKGVSYLFAGFSALTGLVLSVISLRKELAPGKAAHGAFSLALILAVFCTFILLLTAYVPVEQVNSRRTVLSSKK